MLIGRRYGGFPQRACRLLPRRLFSEPGEIPRAGPSLLPARLEAALKSDPRFVELESEVQALTQKEGASSALEAGLVIF